MNKKILSMITIAFLALGMVSAATLVAPPVATVNLIRNTAISQAELDQEYQKYVDAGAEGVTKDQVLDVMINDEVFLQGAERDGIRVSDGEIKQYIDAMKAQFSQMAGQQLSDVQFANLVMQQTGMTLDQYKEALKEQMIVNKYLSAKKGAEIQRNIKAPTDQEIMNFYRVNQQSFYSPENVKLSHVFIEKTDDEAKNQENAKLLMDVAQQIKKGEISFEQAVQKYTTDLDSKKVGGDIGWLTIDNMVARQGFGDDFCNTVLNMDTGEISGMIESNVGYHIVKVTLHNPGKILGLNERINPEDPTTVRDYIYNGLLSQNQNIAMQSALNDLINELRSAAKIKKYI